MRGKKMSYQYWQFYFIICFLFFLTLFHVQRSLHFSELRHHQSNFVCFFGSNSFTGNTVEHFRTSFHRPDFFPVLARGIFKQCLSTRLHTCSWAAEPAAEIALMCRMSPECWVRKQVSTWETPQIPNASVALSSKCTNCEFLAHTDHAVLRNREPRTPNTNDKIIFLFLARFFSRVT